MKILINIILLFTFMFTINAQNITGTVYEKQTNTPLPGVNVYWSQTTSGVTTNANGWFQISTVNKTNKLVFSYVGYTNDTQTITNNQPLAVYILAGKKIDEVTVNQRLSSTVISRINPILTQSINSKELQKCACCNLSESFETNASVDVAYADAVSGIKQIKLLGLSGSYSQLMFENVPILRGYEGAFGLEYVPGTWMQSIQVSKGSASVKNGYEPVTGQINIQYKEPDSPEKMSFYAFANQDGKAETNFIVSMPINNKLSTSVFFHAGGHFKDMDMNNDSFLDMPRSKQINVLNRWNYKTEKMSVKAAINYLTDHRQGGQTGFNHNEPLNTPALYGINVNVERLFGFAKIGFIFNRPQTSLGIILSGNHFKRESFYGTNDFNANQTNAYANIIYQSYLFNPNHTFNTGVSLVHDHNKTTLNINNLGYTETVHGLFAEYNYIPGPKLSLMAGVRYDYSSLNGSMISPRLHAKYNIWQPVTVRASVGKGYITTSALSQNTNLLASSRTLFFTNKVVTEQAWNYGLSIVNDIGTGGKNVQLSVEFFRTNFTDQLIVDLQQNTHEAHFYSLAGKSYSNSAQIEAFTELFTRFEITTAFRFNDVKATYKNGLQNVPMVSRYKGLLSGQYRTRMDKWVFDATMQLHGTQTLPNTLGNNPQNVRPNTSEPYVIVLAQITKNYKRWSFYAGAENLTNYTQKNAVIDAQNPFGNEFDASMVWGPLYGRMFYAGIKYVVNK